MLKCKGILTENQKELLTHIGKIPDSNYFYLTGGTALAEFYFGHRRSYDIDLFTNEKKIIIPFSKVLEENLVKHNWTIKAIRRFESFAEFQVDKNGKSLRLHIAYDTPFRFEERQTCELGIRVNNYKDLIVDKLLAFFGRWTHRDAVDLFFILKNENIEKLVALAKEKDPGFDLYWFAIALKEVDQFPDNIENWLVEMLVEIKIEELKKMFRNLAKDYMHKVTAQRELLNGSSA